MSKWYCDEKAKEEARLVGYDWESWSEKLKLLWKHRCHRKETFEYHSMQFHRALKKERGY